jgi:hypothetical protein
MRKNSRLTAPQENSYVASIKRNYYLAVFSAVAPAILLVLFSTAAQAVPKGQVFEKFNDQGADIQDLGYQPMHEVNPPVDYTLHPNLTPFVNEAHPYPDYIKKFARKGQFPKHYLELISTAPVDKVQSKVFNIQDFKKARRIGVAGFENKTAAPFKDENAGLTVANQAFQELLSYGRYQVIPPRKAQEDARIKITKTPSSPKGPDGSGPEGEQDRSVASLPHSKDKVDAVMIGAVTKFMDSYIDRRGKKKESISSGVEFGAFLINAKTGDVIWGARFVGTQTPNFNALLKGQTRWLNKEELSRSAMKEVLKAFHNTKR